MYDEHTKCEACPAISTSKHFYLKYPKLKFIIFIIVLILAKTGLLKMLLLFLDFCENREKVTTMFTLVLGTTSYLNHRW